MGSRGRVLGNGGGVCLLYVTPPAMCSPSEEARVCVAGPWGVLLWPSGGVALLRCGPVV